MKRFSRSFALFAALFVILAVFAGCNRGGLSSGNWSGQTGPHGLRYAKEQVVRRVYNTEVTKFAPFNNSDSATDWNFNALGTKGLLTTDKYGQIVPGLASSFEVSPDGTVYTFQIRQGLPYVDHTKKRIPNSELTADDFVAVMEWVLDPTHLSPNAGSFNNYILNAEQYYKGEVGLDQVGFKATGKYTLQLTLKNPVPYFLSIASFMPVWRPFLEKQGILYGTELERTIFIGPYILTTFEPQYRRVYEKNPYYYNAKEVYIEKIIDTYNAESDLLGPELFLRGEIDWAAITSDILDMWMQNPDTKNFVCPGKPDPTYQYYYMFNFWPQFDSRFEPDNWNIAVNNEAFRQSLFWALDTYRALLTLDPYTPEVYLQSTITAKDFASVAGKDYVDFAPLKDFAHHPTWLFVPEKALAYKEQAVRELRAQGAKFPIKIYMTYNPNVASWPLEVQVVAQQLVELLGADYIEPVIETGPASNFNAEIRRAGKYAFLKGNNGAVAPEDPESWVYAFQPGMNWNFIDKGTGAETQATYAKYVELVNKAKAITVKSEARYMAFAEAEAFLLSHAFVIPFYTDTDGYQVYRYNFWDGYGQNGYEGRKVLADPMTGEQWKLLYADWQAGKQAAIAGRK